MTQYGWDTSHYDDRNGIDLAVMRRAVAEGIVFVTAKIGEGGNYDDPADAGTLGHARDAGVKALGGYYVVRTPAMVGASLAEQVAHCVRLMDEQLPWWRDFPYWFGQVDLERWPYDPVKPRDGIEFGHRLQDATDRVAVMYGSKGQYGDTRAGWDGPLWNANYPSGRAGGFKALYPGDHGPGWVSYSGRPEGAEFWQYTSSATIAGLTTCDANAYRGTLAELLALITPGGTDMAGFDKTDLHTLLTSPAFPYTDPKTSLGTTWDDTHTNTEQLLTKVDALTASQAGQDLALKAMAATLTTVMQAGGTDAAPLLAKLDEMAAAESAAFAAVLAENRDLKGRLAAALTAAGNTLTGDAPPE